MHLGSQQASGRTPDSEPVFTLHDPVELDDGQQLHPTSIEKRILTVAPQVRDCLVASARLRGLGPDPSRVPSPTDRVPVAFAGDGEGVAELTWGQREIWQSMTRQGNWLPLGGWRPLDPGTTIESIADELAYLHGRFPSMRT